MKTATPAHKIFKSAHTPVETDKWLHVTIQKAQLRFSEFFKLLDDHKSIPYEYTSPLTFDGKGCNRLFRFFRPESILDILVFIQSLVLQKKPGMRKLEASIKDIFIPFDESWNTLLNKLDTYYGDNDTVAPLRSKYTYLLFASRMFQGGANTLLDRLSGRDCNRPLDIWADPAAWMDEYKTAFKEFRNEFEKLPKHSKLKPLSGLKDTGLPFDPSTDEYTIHDLQATWSGSSRYEKNTNLDFSFEYDDGKIKQPLTYNLFIDNGYYHIKIKDHTFHFDIPSDEAKAFIDLLIDSLQKKFKIKGGIFKPIMLIEKGKSKGKKSNAYLRQVKFNSKDKKIGTVLYHGSYKFWKYFILQENIGSSDGRVTLGLHNSLCKKLIPCSKP